MDINTGKIYEVENEDHLKKLEVDLNTKLVPLTEKQAKNLKPLSNRKRKFLMKKGDCICGSLKSFKKCCYRKYKKQI